MGGSAFTHGSHALSTPRMPRDVYDAEKERCKVALRRLYHCVACPIEGPGKTDFGDLDLFVALEKATSEAKSDPRVDIQRELGAEFVILGNGCSHFAIPWPVTPTDEPLPDDEEKRYIQVDVTICQSPDSMQWSLFKHAHGDLWSILGSIIRPYGLTIDEVCLSIRIPELERSDRKKARVPLTNEPGDVLSFLGLPDGRFWEEPFPNRQEMYQYLTQCPMFRVRPLDAGVEAIPSPETGGAEQTELNASDRKRLTTRPAFREWTQSFLRDCRVEGHFLERRTNRDDVLRGAFERFQVKDEYQRRLDHHITEQQVFRIKSSIKELFPAPEGPSPAQKEIQYRGCLLKALTRIVIDGDTSYGIVPDQDTPLKDSRGCFITENVIDFINRNHEAIGAAAMARHHQAFLDRKLALSQAQTQKQD